MRLLATLAASCLLALCAAEAEASVVNFQGTIQNGGSDPLGTYVTSGGYGATTTFTLTVNFTDGTGPTPVLASVTSGTFDVPTPNDPADPVKNFLVSGGTILVGEGSPEDAATFVVGVTGPMKGELRFTFTADAISTAIANQANIGALISNRTVNFEANFATGGGGAYFGKITGETQITAVPEPSSCLALLGLVGGGAWKWRRRRRAAA